MKTFSLSRNQLKLLAILAMVVDHTAWGFVEFMSPLGQAMHIFGRLTLPIMCFFIAEGYRHTSNLTKYIERMVTFAIISVLPFYLFFHEEYYFRQNIIFDLTLALLALCVSDCQKIPVLFRILGVVALLVVSALIGGWVIMPIIYVLVFYYKDTFQKKAFWFTFYTIVLEICLITLISLNQIYHFSKYNWAITERLYLLGFVFALIPLYFYNGQKGQCIISPQFERYFFYAFYPLHFMVLYIIKWAQTATSQDVYIWAHVLALAVGIALFIYALRQPASRSQVGVCIFMISGVFYIFGFLMEITTPMVPGVFNATKLQYFAEIFVLISITYCIQELTHTKITGAIYAAEGIISVFTLYCLFTYEKNHLFYKGITINSTAGSFPRMEIIGYGPVFYLFVVYSLAVCILCIGIGVHSAISGGSLQRKRLRYLLLGMVSMWFSYLIKPLNLTNGYEIPALFIPFTAFFIVVALARYNYLDSISLNFSNAISKGQEGILIVDRNHKVLYANEFMHKLLGNFSRFEDAYHIPEIKEIFESAQPQLERNGHTYEIRIEPLIEQGHHTGDILWMIDLTKHYEAYNQVKKESTHDSLSGLHNRKWFEENVKACFNKNIDGAFLMIDLDHFKQVNDTYGHKIGDLAIKITARTIRECMTDIKDTTLYAGRLGGDEFCIFIEKEKDKEVLGAFATHMLNTFEEHLKENGYGGITSLSMGIALLDAASVPLSEKSFDEVYEKADEALYQAKKDGRKTYHFSE